MVVGGLIHLSDNLLYLVITFQKCLQHEQQNRANDGWVELYLGKLERTAFINVLLRLIDRGQYSENEHLLRLLLQQHQSYPMWSPLWFFHFWLLDSVWTWRRNEGLHSSATSGTFLVEDGPFYYCMLEILLGGLSKQLYNQVNGACDHLLRSLLGSLVLYYPMDQYKCALNHPAAAALEEWISAKDYSDGALKPLIYDAGNEKEHLKVTLLRIDSCLPGVLSCLPDFRSRNGAIEDSSYPSFLIAGATGSSVGSTQQREKASEVIHSACKPRWALIDKADMHSMWRSSQSTYHLLRTSGNFSPPDHLILLMDDLLTLFFA
ncbi:hypothetical protein PTKIN_Ptkin10aG0009900 [Pterospermum kingtungense]